MSETMQSVGGTPTAASSFPLTVKVPISLELRAHNQEDLEYFIQQGRLLGQESLPENDEEFLMAGFGFLADVREVLTDSLNTEVVTINNLTREQIQTSLQLEVEQSQQ